MFFLSFLKFPVLLAYARAHNARDRARDPGLEKKFFFSIFLSSHFIKKHSLETAIIRV